MQPKPSMQKMPEAVMTASRIELTDLGLEVLEGYLPPDLQGHLFFVGPVGSVDSGGLPYPNGDPIFNGDGMVYRVDFDSPEPPRISTRLAKTPDFYADQATQKLPQYHDLKFCNHGVARFSFGLGMRNQLNTALVPFQFAQDKHPRLLVTFDAGRHYELDPVTLKVVTPVGSNREWRPETTFLSPFFPVLSTAHPIFDQVQNELLTVNYGRSLGSFLSALPLIAAAEQCPVAIARWLEAIANLFHLKGPVKAIFKAITQTSQALLSQVGHLIDRVVPINMADFVYLMRWDGQGDIERWRLVLADGSPVKIRQSLHQICATRNYIILVDTAFSIGMAEVFNNPLPAEKTLERLLRYLLSSPAAPNSTLYLVRRADLQQGQYPAQSSPEVTVVAQPLDLPMEVLHFAADYDDPDDQLTLHLGHICAVMAADWIRAFDVLATDAQTPVPPRLNGIGTEIMDVSRLGRYRIDAQSGQVLESKLTFDLQRTWGVEFYTYRNYPCFNAPPQRLRQIYWTTYGFWPEILSNFSLEAFKDYRYRLVPEADLLKSSGIPAGLFRLDTETMTLADSYPDRETGTPSADLLLNSPQFIPRRGDTSEDPTQGYIVCTAFAGDRAELWIFDAQNLKLGPLCKLGHPRLNFGFTLHSAWLPQIHSRTASYNIPVVEDYQPFVQTKSQSIRELFQQEIYPHY